MGAENMTNGADTDLALLIEKLNKVAEGDFRYAKPEEFTNPGVAEAVNAVINNFSHRNNHFLVRINDAMTRIGDNSVLKVLFDELDSQTDSIEALKFVKNDFVYSRTVTEDSGARVFALAKQVRRSLAAYSGQIDSSIEILTQMVEKYNISGDVKTEVDDAVDKLKYQSEGMMSTSYRLRDMEKDMSNMYYGLEEQGKKYQMLYNAIDSITQSFNTLFNDCLSVGNHLYRISRDIDMARNDMYRKNSWPLLHDRLKVFTIDHMTLTWRLYNHIIEYENLRLEQVNNPDSCKLGTWLQAEIARGSELSQSAAFQNIVSLHYELHDHAVTCFLLKESFKKEEALREFDLALETYGRFEAGMNEFHAYLNSIGIFDETEVWKFENSVEAQRAMKKDK